MKTYFCKLKQHFFFFFYSVVLNTHFFPLKMHTVHTTTTADIVRNIRIVGS